MASQLVVLNVGGTLFTTTAATLCSPAAEGSMLARLASLHLDSNNADASGGTSMQAGLKDPTHPGALFIDRDGSLFRYILGYLRDGGKLVPPLDLHSTQLLLREAEFYQLPGLVKLLRHNEARLLAEHRARANMPSSLNLIEQHLDELLQASQVWSQLDKDSLLTDIKALRQYLAPGVKNRAAYGYESLLLQDLQYMLRPLK